MREREHTRRRFLALAGGGTVTALGGCLGGRGDPPDGSTGTETETGTETDAETTKESTETTEAEDTKMSTIFHFSGSEGQQRHAIANASNLMADETVDLGEVELVANGSGIALLTEDSTVSDGVASLIEEGATVCACENTMAAKDLTEDDLLPDVGTVPSAVGELTKRQAEGYAYIKTP